MGDGMLVSFPLASDAVRCAQWILLESEKQNISLRIGIHQSELIFENSDVLGDGVNVASRLQEITEPGRIAVSEPVYRDVKNKAGIHVRFLGEENFKNVADPLKVYDVKSEVDKELWEDKKYEDSEAKNNSFITRNKFVIFSIVIGLMVAIALILFWQFEPFKKDSIVENAEIEKTIAVLPFKSDSPDQENEYFCNGMMEAILNHLANIKDLKVLSRTDVEIYRNSSKSREEIARELGVVNILEGSVYKVGNNFRLSVQLINAENGFHLWSDAIEGEYTEEIFAVQSRIAEQVANAMYAVISSEEMDKINAIPTSHITAYDYSLRGKEMIRNYWRSSDKKYLNQALDLYDKALQVDPEFSQALYLKSQIYFAQRKYDSTIVLAKRNIELNPYDASSYYIIGECYRFQYDMKSAIKYLSKAVELKPERSWPNLALGSAHFSQKNGAAKGAKYLQNALDNMERSMAPELFLHIGLNFLNIGDFEQAEKYISDALDL
jgi:TolB-like protein